MRELQHQVAVTHVTHMVWRGPFSGVLVLKLLEFSDSPSSLLKVRVPSHPDSGSPRYFDVDQDLGIIFQGHNLPNQLYRQKISPEFKKKKNLFLRKNSFLLNVETRQMEYILRTWTPTHTQTAAEKLVNAERKIGCLI